VVFVILWKYNILNTSRFFDTTGFYGSSIAGDQELDKIGADKLWLKILAKLVWLKKGTNGI